ncbi:uncharacterized protein PHACADRAFT_258430 [Phanerochaete carnosa HHB-10118-sp]|uniref:Uncharacterized protein n=1 Tax=Phanerochaete carnosa (strain HHB-10118-sp) TaxID=650164 RepID=K5WVP1_PHACS|nr:uncharacterized protein PHACADRAFT_258430 [Phanerochaete carnosa HHB-10118-sp]EKM54522.1 hypothetical protein PHACADRAFT_258430 [Phanerochaete carnosa HHB-10118-sp]
MGKFTFMSFLSEQWTRLPPPLQVDLTGKTVIVTGSNTGIGLEAAMHFARMRPARLIVACRSEDKGKAALEHIAQKSGYAAELQLVDFADFASVTAFAARLKDAPVDILVANAGVGLSNFSLTKDGFEQALQVNHLSSALLSFLLLPNLVKAAQEHKSNSRLALVTSEMHFTTRVDDELKSAPKGILRTLSDPEYVTPERFSARYPETKMFNVMFARALAEHLPAAVPVVPDSVNPGFCYTELRRNLWLSRRLMMAVMDFTLGRSAEQGARQLVHAALGPDGKDGEHIQFMRGAYVSCNAVHEPSDFVISKEGHEVQERIWRETIDILAEASPDIRRIVKEYCT